MLQKTIKRSVGNPELIRLYIFSAAEKMNELITDYKKNFTRSISIMDNGRLDKSKIDYINGLATESWDDICTNHNSYFLLTREDLSIKTEDEKRKAKAAKRITQIDTSTTLSAIAPKKDRYPNWTASEMAKLYTGTIKEVAAALNKTYAMVYGRRQKYEEENPTFVVPECAIKQPKKEIEPKMKEKKPTYKQIVSELTQAEIDILWNNSSAELRTKYADIFQSIFVIAALRTEYCKANPEFVIPLAAQFNQKNLPNKVEEKFKANIKLVETGITEDEMALIWAGSSKEVSAIINKHCNTIHHARIAYCKANPTFVIPAIAKFKAPLDVFNPREMVEPVVEPTKKPTKESKLDTRTEVKTEKITQPVQHVEQIIQQPVQQNTMAEMFALLTSSGMVPKKATFKNGEVSFEF